MTTKSKLLFKQPPALYILAFAELWERFSFYGIQAILVLYLTKQFAFTDQAAEALFGSYLVFGYTLPLLGGLIADRLMGFRQAITLGALLIAAGNFILARGDYHAIIAGLAIVIMGTGLFKPNVSSLLGEFYEINDPRRNSGFTLFYIGINIGAMAAIVIYAYLTKYFDWHAGFQLSGIGMLLGLLVFKLFRAKLENKGNAPRRVNAAHSFYWIYPVIALLIAAVIFFLQRTLVMEKILALVAAGLLLIQLYLAFKSPPEQRNNILLLMLLWLGGACFYAVILQLGSSFVLFTDRNVDLHFFNWQIPAASLSMLESFFVVTLGFVFSWLWIYLARRNREPSFLTKFTLGLIFACLSFWVLSIGAAEAIKTGRCSLLWLVLMYLLQALGDLCLSPSGLSAVTVLAPQRLIGFFMGIWFVGIAMGGYFAGAVGKITDVSKKLQRQHSLIASANIYHHAFMLMFEIGLVVCAIALMLNFAIARSKKR